MKAKSTLFEIARWLCALLAVAVLIFMFGGNAVSDADPETVVQEVTGVLDMTNMVEGDNQMIKRFYGLDPSVFEACYLYYPTTNMMAEELLIIQLKDVSQQEAVRTAVEARIQTQKNTFEGYGVEQFEMLSNNAVVELRGNYVLFVVNSKSAEALRAFLGAL